MDSILIAVRAGVACERDLTGRADLPVLLSLYLSAAHRAAIFCYHFCGGQPTGTIQNDSKKSELFSGLPAPRCGSVNPSTARKQVSCQSRGFSYRSFRPCLWAKHRASAANRLWPRPAVGF
ncbi:hypothetical protein F6F93_22380 [Salmonella enterica]|nr:hypothetical protein [Salmonella enterica]